ncbi:MAG: hypothetical protein ACLGH0_04150 [Thermoanaerobaculia bacterium]
MKKLLLLTLLATNAFANPEAFSKLKTLAGTWEGSMTTTPQVPSIEGTAARVTLRVTSMGHVLMHEMTGEGREDDPITMLYLQDEHLALTHYCDAGNRPRMNGTVSDDGKSVAFESVEVDGSTEHGHMHKAVFTFVDETRHIEEWTYMLPGSKPMKVRVELRRVP